MNIYLVGVIVLAVIIIIEIALMIYTKKFLNAINGLSKLYTAIVENTERIVGHFE